MTPETILMLFAVLASPLLAVQVTRLLDDRKERKQRRVAIYRTLMATRAAPVSHQHVEALNSIDLEFHNQRADEPIRLAWKAYLSHLGDRDMEAIQWGVRRTDLLIALLKRMGDRLGYKFDETHIKDGIYNPDYHGQLGEDQDFIRIALRDLLAGRRALPVAILEPGQKALQESQPGQTAFESNEHQ